MRCSYLVSFLVLGAVACGDNKSGATRTDASTADSSTTDSPSQGDAGTDAPDLDASADASPDALNGGDAIATARATADGTGLSLSIPNVIVTYIKPALGDPAYDSAGFTVQASQTGPALMIAVDPTTLSPVPAVGDVVSFTITEMITNHDQRRASAITDWTRVSQGANVAALVQNVTGTTDLVSAVSDYDSEVIDATMTVASAFTASGASFQAAPVNTTGITGNTNLRLRMPTTLRDAYDVVAGCTVVLHGTPVEQFQVSSTSSVQAELHAYTASDFTLSTCPAPTVTGATALSSTSVRFTFSRNVLASSVMADGSQFTFDNGLTATAASVSGRTVTVTTSAQVGNATYTGTVATTVTDLQGTALAAPTTAMFAGYVIPAVVRINELNANIASSCDLIELRVISGGTIGGYYLRERDTGKLITFPAMVVAKNAIIVVHMIGSNAATCNPGTATDETASIVGQPALTYTANYDTAYDFYSTDTGLTSTDNVITLYDSSDSIIDAVFIANAATGTAAAGSETQAAEVAAADQWEIPNDGGVPAGGFVDDDFRANAVLDSDGTSTTKTGTTIQRNDDADNNDKDDWTDAAATWGALNVGQSLL